MLTNLSLVASWEDVQIRQQGTCLQGLLIALLVEGQAHEDVVPQAAVLDPGLLGCVAHPAPHLHTDSMAGAKEKAQMDVILQVALLYWALGVCFFLSFVWGMPCLATSHSHHHRGCS